MTDVGRTPGGDPGDAKDLEWYARRYEEAGRRVVELESELAERLQRHAVETAAERGEAGRLRDELALQGDEIRAVTTENGLLRDRVGKLEAERERLVEQMELQGTELRTMLDSRSWRATRLIRELRWFVFPPQGGDADPTRSRASGR